MNEELTLGASLSRAITCLARSVSASPIVPMEGTDGGATSVASPGPPWRLERGIPGRCRARTLLWPTVKPWPGSASPLPRDPGHRQTLMPVARRSAKTSRARIGPGVARGLQRSEHPRSST
jgi:hypothetical protein